MTIVKCSKCGNYIHKNDRCFVCGNVNGFEKVFYDNNIHRNVTFEFEKLEMLISNGKFDEALKLSYTVLEWMPTSASVFWMRLLAKNHCKNDEELIKKGFIYSESAEYYNACRYADDFQKKAYELVIKKINDVKESLMKKIHKIEYLEKEKLPILKYDEELPTEIKKYEDKLFSLWSDLKKTELDIRAIETNCQLLIQEQKITLTNANTLATSLKSEVYKLSECTEDELHKYQIKFGDLLYLTEQAANSVNMMKKQHPWLKEYEVLVSKRDKICSEITSELNNLRNYQVRIKTLISSIENIEEKSQKAKDAVEKYEFIFAKTFLGEMEYSDAILKAEVR